MCCRYPEFLHCCMNAIWVLTEMIRNLIFGSVIAVVGNNDKFQIETFLRLQKYLFLRNLGCPSYWKPIDSM